MYLNLNTILLKYVKMCYLPKNVHFSCSLGCQGPQVNQMFTQNCTIICRRFHAVLQYGSCAVPACQKGFAYTADNSVAGLCMQIICFICTLPAIQAKFIISERDYANAVLAYWNMQGCLTIKCVSADILGLSDSHAHHC